MNVQSLQSGTENEPRNLQSADNEYYTSVKFNRLPFTHGRTLLLHQRWW